MGLGRLSSVWVRPLCCKVLQALCWDLTWVRVPAMRLIFVWVEVLG